MVHTEQWKFSLLMEPFTVHCQICQTIDITIVKMVSMHVVAVAVVLMTTVLLWLMDSGHNLIHCYITEFTTPAGHLKMVDWCWWEEVSVGEQLKYCHQEPALLLKDLHWNMIQSIVNLWNENWIDNNNIYSGVHAVSQLMVMSWLSLEESTHAPQCPCTISMVGSETYPISLQVDMCMPVDDIKLRMVTQ